jgi:hypothetical protein
MRSVSAALKAGSPGRTAGVQTAARTKPWLWIE